MRIVTHTDFAKALTVGGYKLPLPRRAVPQGVAENSALLTPAEIHHRARELYPQAGLVTVYRTLEVLVECGAIRRIHQSDGCHAYARASEGHAHHVICE